MLVGGLWAAIAGALKAYADAHEVITTIMLNYIAAQFAGWLISTGSDGSAARPLASPESVTDAIARTPPILSSAKLPIVYSVPPNFTLHIGIFVAIIASVVIMFLLQRTTFGFQLRMTGYSPTAAEYAGVNVKQVTILTMFIAGVLAGLAGGIRRSASTMITRAARVWGLASKESWWPSWPATIPSPSTSPPSSSARWTPVLRAWRWRQMSPKS